jgi:hypothetical protein
MIALLDSRITLALAGFIGMAMCSARIGRVAASGRWADPLSIVGYILGLAALGYCQLNNPGTCGIIGGMTTASDLPAYTG